MSFDSSERSVSSYFGVVVRNEERKKRMRKILEEVIAINVHLRMRVDELRKQHIYLEEQNEKQNNVVTNFIMRNNKLKKLVSPLFVEPKTQQELHKWYPESEMIQLSDIALIKTPTLTPFLEEKSRFPHWFVTEVLGENLDDIPNAARDLVLKYGAGLAKSKNIELRLTQLVEPKFDADKKYRRIVMEALIRNAYDEAKMDIEQHSLPLFQTFPFFKNVFAVFLSCFETEFRQICLLTAARKHLETV